MGYECGGSTFVYNLFVLANTRWKKKGTSLFPPGQPMNEKISVQRGASNRNIRHRCYRRIRNWFSLFDDLKPSSQ